MDGPKDRTREGVTISLLSAFMLGTSWVAIKVGLSDLDPLFYSMIVFAIGALIMVIYTVARGTFKLAIFKRWEAWAAPAVTYVLLAAQYTGLDSSSAATGALIVGSNIILVAPMSALFFRQKLRRLQLAGLGLGILGLIALTTKFDPTALGGSTLLGNLLLIVASASLAFSYVLSRIALRHMTFDQWTLVIHLFTPVLLFVTWIFLGHASTFRSDTWALILYVGIFCTSVPVLIWARALNWISIVTSSTVMLSESVFGVTLSILLLNEPIDWYVVIGAAMVFVAIYMVIRGTTSQEEGNVGEPARRG